MKLLSWLLFVSVIILLGYLVVSSAFKGRPQPGLAANEVNSDTIAAYRLRAESLAVRADSIRTRLGTLGFLARPAVRAHVLQMEAEIAALNTAIAGWQASRPVSGTENLYGRCVLMYGRASGVCDALAQDTLLP